MATELQEQEDFQEVSTIYSLWTVEHPWLEQSLRHRSLGFTSLLFMSLLHEPPLHELLLQELPWLQELQEQEDFQEV